MKRIFVEAKKHLSSTLSSCDEDGSASSFGPNISLHTWTASSRAKHNASDGPLQKKKIKSHKINVYLKLQLQSFL